MKSISNATSRRTPLVVPLLPPLESKKVMDQLRERIRYLHYSRRTEQAYCTWVKDYLCFHKLCHPVEMSKAEVEDYLSHLANARKVAAATHKQALSTLLFFTLRS